MNGKYFLDTNIFVYSFDRKAKSKMRRAMRLIREGVATRKAVISYQVVQEFFNVALPRFDQPMHVAEAEKYLSTVFRPLLTVHSSETLLAQALQLCE
jgi:predicted nucleic acid-binding protein